ncbi:response regulator [Hyphococcus sp. DH-69]|uniref:response regulator n=1 Tax=Hyphococcus formosus TaxID=3143534 RepID=UPI00398BA314
MKLMKSASTDGTGPSGTRLMVSALAAGTVTVLLIFGLFATFHDFSEHDLRRKELEKYLETVGTATAWGADNWLTHRTRLTENIADTLADTFDGNNAVEIVKSPVYEKTFIWTYFGEVDGSYHIWPADDQLPSDYDPRSRPWYSAALMAKKATLTEPYFDITTNVETITVASPVYRDRELLGVVGADFSTLTLAEMLAETNLGGLGFAFLVTGDGKILAHPDRDLVSKDIAFAYPGQRPNIDNEIQYLDTMKNPQIVSFYRIPNLGSVDWYLGLSIDKRAAFHSVHEFRQSAAVATLVACLLMIVVLGFVIHRVLVRPLMNARKAADAANVAKSDFLASMSHEIRTPMNGVLGMAEILSSTDLDQRQHELASIIISSGNALMAVINDILDFAKLEAGKLKLAPRPFNLRQTVYEVTTMMQARAHEQDIELIVRYAPDLPEGVIADDSRLRQVLGNLIGNAVKFTEKGYVLVEVTGEKVGTTIDLMFSVKDTGVGISSEQIPRMFEKFEQADGSHTRKFGGTGLGLAICRDIVELMGGKIGAESEIGAGSRFWFKLNLPVDEEIRSLPVVKQDTFDQVRILGVDDNAVNRRILQEFLDGWGFRSTIVGDPVKAMAELEKSRVVDDEYHALILDYQMPGEDGVSLAKRIQADPKFANIPTIILTSIDEAMATASKEGVRIDKLLSKPIRPSRLMDSIAAILSDSAPRLLRRSAQIRQEGIAKERKNIAAAGRKTILVAEDNQVNQLVIKRFLDESRFDIIIAENGEEAVELYQKHSPAIVFMDLSMPVMDGISAAQKIREYERTRGMNAVPIIAATAHVLDSDRTRCISAGMNDFLSKPMKKDAVEDVLDRWLVPAAVEVSA